MTKKEFKIQENNEKINELRKQYKTRMLNLHTFKDIGEFLEENRACTSLVCDINTLEKKNKFIAENLPSHGVADISDKVTIID